MLHIPILKETNYRLAVSSRPSMHLEPSFNHPSDILCTARYQTRSSNTPPLHHQAGQKRKACCGNRQDEGCGYSLVVRQQYSRKLLRGRDFPDMCRSCRDNNEWIHRWCVNMDLLEERFGEDVLGYGDGDGAAEGVLLF
jgi:hypothetical protein